MTIEAVPEVGARGQGPGVREERSALEPGTWNLEPSDEGAVSYTHLDVYKRQGKKRMKMIGNVEVPQEAFLAVLKLGED